MAGCRDQARWGKTDPQGVNSLLRLRRRVDTNRVGEPSAMVVITATGYGFEHRESVQVIPIATLGP